MTILRRSLLKAFAAAGAGALFLPRLGGRLYASEPAAADLVGLRDKIDHIVVIFQENRSFDHYFGAYRPPGGGAVASLLDKDGNIDPRFTGLQKNAAGVPYDHLPLPYEMPGFADALLENRPFHLAPYIPAGANVPWDPQHHFFRMWAQMDDGAMDRFVALALAGKHKLLESGVLRDPADQMFAQSTPSGAVIGFYDRSDLPFYHHLADEYVLLDHFFQAMSGGSTGNALYLVAARSAVRQNPPAKDIGSLAPPIFDKHYDKAGIMINDMAPVNGPTEVYMGPLDQSPPPDEQTYPNIGDRLNAAGLDWAWYNEDWNAVKPWAMKTAFGPGDGSIVIDSSWMYQSHHNPFQYYPSWFGNVKGGHIRDAQDFFEDLRGGRLPRVSFIKASGAHDEHPAKSAPRWGEAWVKRLLEALGASRHWGKSAAIVTYDEGGGLWDHVAPPHPDGYGCGTRVPAMLIGPFSRRGYIDRRVADTTSVLALIEARFGLEPLQQRDAQAYNLTGGFDFTQPARPPAFG